MASYNEFFEIKVEGTKVTINSICEAIRNYTSYADITCSGENIVIYDMCKIANEDDAREFAQMLAKASNGASFKAVGNTECSISGEIMAFIIELKNGELTSCNSDWFTMSTPSMYEEYDTYEEYCEDYGDWSEIKDEEEFKILKSQNAYFVDGELHLEIPYFEVVRIEY